MKKEFYFNDHTHIHVHAMLSLALILVFPFFATEGNTLDNGNTIEFNCQFVNKAGPGDMETYYCRVRNLNLTTDVEVISVSGSHLPGKSNADVKGINFVSGSMLSIPTGIGKFFDNLVVMAIGNGADSQIKVSNIKRTSLSELNKLENLTIFTSAIPNIDCDAFWDLPNLNQFVLFSTGSTTLHEHLFLNNPKLTAVVIVGAILDDIPTNLFRNNLLLHFVAFERCSLKTIDETLFETNRNLRVVDFQMNKLEHLPKDLLKNSLSLAAVAFGENLLQTIDIDFTKFNKIQVINLDDNVCINAYYETRGLTYDSLFTNLTELQSVITANCSSHSHLWVPFV